MDITFERLHNQHLAGQKIVKPGEVVSWLGAVQSQDYAGAKWALGLRMKDANSSIIEEAFNQGTILRTHVMRPTWHFVTPEDIRSLLELTAPRVKSLLANYDRKLGLSEELLSRSRRAISEALEGANFLTRDELSERLQKNSVNARGQMLGNILMHCELEGLICSGPRKGKHFTYALMNERISKSKKIDRGKVLGKLALRYFASHGPAQLKDFAWWSGLSSKEAMEGLEYVIPELESETHCGKVYWFSQIKNPPIQKSSMSYLLSIYDEYVIAYRDRGAIGWEGKFGEAIQRGNLVSGVVILDGKIAGSWKRMIRKEEVEVMVSLLKKPTTAEEEAIESAVSRYGTFLELPTKLIKSVSR